MGTNADVTTGVYTSQHLIISQHKYIPEKKDDAKYAVRTNVYEYNMAIHGKVRTVQCTVTYKGVIDLILRKYQLLEIEAFSRKIFSTNPIGFIISRISFSSK